MNPMQMMQKAQQMQKMLQTVQEQLGTMTVTGQAGGGVVQVVMTGKNEVKSVTIDPSIIDATDRDTLQDLVLTAVNDAVKKASALAEGEMKKVTGGMGLPF